MLEKKTAIVLLSGGLDSTTVVAYAKSKGFDVYALSFSYGQRHTFELDCAKNIATKLDVKEHRIVEIGLGAFGGSALTTDIEVPKNRIETDSEIPITYVPARNTIFLSYALALAEVTTSKDIFIGVNAVDYSGYPDCRPEYISAFQKMANLATKAGVTDENPLTIHTPLMDLKKSEIIQLGLSLGVDYGMTSTCYDPDSQGAACGKCDACILRLQGFEEAGVKDSAIYQ